MNRRRRRRYTFNGLICGAISAIVLIWLLHLTVDFDVPHYGGEAYGAIVLLDFGGLILLTGFGTLCGWLSGWEADRADARAEARNKPE